MTLLGSVLKNKSKRKNSFVLLTAIVCVFTGISLYAKPILTALQADLMPITNNFGDNGIIFVINQGSQVSNSTWLTLRCSGTCPDHPEIAAYTNALFPDRVAIKIPSLKSGQVFKHKLAFWDKVSFGSGNAKVLFFVDAGSLIAESNEKNNKKVVVLSGNKTMNNVGLYRNAKN